MNSKTHKRCRTRTKTKFEEKARFSNFFQNSPLKSIVWCPVIKTRERDEQNGVQDGAKMEFFRRVNSASDGGGGGSEDDDSLS